MHSRIGLCSGFERVEIADRIVQIDYINVLCIQIEQVHSVGTLKTVEHALLNNGGLEVIGEGVQSRSANAAAGSAANDENGIHISGVPKKALGFFLLMRMSFSRGAISGGICAPLLPISAVDSS